MAMPVYTSSGAPDAVTNGVGAHTKGSYTTILAATPADSSRLHLGVCRAETAAKRHMLDWAIGAAGAEVVVVANIPHDPGSNVSASLCLPYDVDVPSGTRLACRCQGVDAGGDQQIHVWAMHENRALGGLSNPVTYGANTATSKGTAVDPGAVADTKGAYAEITATTTAAHQAVHVYANKNSPTNNDPLRWRLDVAIGAAGVEVVAIPDISVACDAGESRAYPTESVFALSVNSGVRLASRVMCDVVSDANDRILSVVIVGTGRV